MTSLHVARRQGRQTATDDYDDGGQQMKVLVTNDDGVASPGLHELAAALVAAGYDVIVVAPDRDMSGSAAALGQIHVDEEIEAEPVDLPGLDGVPAYAVDGPPGLCVLAARLGGFGEPPQLVVSGINPGCNAGRAILHSGTVGAALTAANFGCRGLAVSLDVSSRTLHERAGRAGHSVPSGPSVPAGDGSEATAQVVAGDGSGRSDGADRAAYWGSAAAVAVTATRWLATAPDLTVLNVNVPNRPVEHLSGARLAELAPFGTVRSSVVESSAGGGRLQMELRPTTDEVPPDSDTGLVARGYVAVTPIVGPRAADLDVSAVLDSVSLDAASARRSA
jgi:5'-nucleotidase